MQIPQMKVNIVGLKLTTGRDLDPNPMPLEKKFQFQRQYNAKSLNFKQ